MLSVRTLIAAIALAFGLFMAVRGLFGLQAGLMPVPIAPTLFKLQYGQPIEPLVLEAARRHLRVSADGTAISVAGVIASERARAVGIRTPEGQQWLKGAVSDLRRGLARAPADGLSWLRLASSEYLLNGMSPIVTSSMRMGLFTARSSFEAVPLLLSLSVVAWPQMSPDLQEFALKSVRDQWPNIKQRERLHRLALTEMGRTILKMSLGDRPEVDQWVKERIAKEIRDQERRKARMPR